MTSASVHLTARRLILGLSLFALLLVLGATVLTTLGRLDPSPDGDEGTPARLFQLAIVLLFPVGAAFLATANWDRPREVVRELRVPILALLLAFATLFYMERLM